MLYILAQADTTGVRADRDAELCSHQHDGEIFVDAGDSAAIDLADIDGSGLEELLEHDAVVTVFAGGDTCRCRLAANAGVTKDVVWAGGLFHPPRPQLGELAGAGDGFGDSPLLIGVNHHVIMRADRVAHDATAMEVVFAIATNLELDRKSTRLNS